MVTLKTRTFKKHGLGKARVFVRKLVGTAEVDVAGAIVHAVGAPSGN